MSIILLRGFSGSGKDYVGKILCDTYDYKRYAFADSLKQIVAEKYECSLECLHSQTGKLQICENDIYKRTFRQILIDEALRLRIADDDIFARHCCEQIQKDGYPSNVVITDWRFPNELEMIKRGLPDYKIIPVHVYREGQEKSQINDISEYYLSDRTDDYVIINTMDSTIYHEVDTLINYISKINTK